MPKRLTVVCEARADMELACHLADRVFCAEVPWIDEEVLEGYRVWGGADVGEQFLPWKDVPQRAKRAGLAAFGHFDGQPGSLEAGLARKALLLVTAAPPFPEGILLVRDDDRELERREGFRQARDTVRLDIPVVLAVAHTKRECWVLAGFDPCDDGETRRLEELRQELGCDPRTHAHELTARHDRDKKSAKRVLRALTNDDRERESLCWLRTDLGRLERRGGSTGLADYLREVREHIVPLFSPR